MAELDHNFSDPEYEVREFDWCNSPNVVVAEQAAIAVYEDPQTRRRFAKLAKRSNWISWPKANGGGIRTNQSINQSMKNAKPRIQMQN